MVKVSPSKKRIFNLVIFQVIQQTAAPLLTLLNYCCSEQGFPGTSQAFSSHFFTILDRVETKIFFFCASLVNFGRRSFSNAFLKTSLLITWSLSDRERSFKDSEAFKHCSAWWTVILLTCICFEISLFLKPSRNKVDVSILLALVRL